MARGFSCSRTASPCPTRRLPRCAASPRRAASSWRMCRPASGMRSAARAMQRRLRPGCCPAPALAREPAGGDGATGRNGSSAGRGRSASAPGAAGRDRPTGGGPGHTPVPQRRHDDRWHPASGWGGRRSADGTAPAGTTVGAIPARRRAGGVTDRLVLQLVPIEPVLLALSAAPLPAPTLSGPAQAALGDLVTSGLGWMGLRQPRLTSCGWRSSARRGRSCRWRRARCECRREAAFGICPLLLATRLAIGRCA